MNGSNHYDVIIIGSGAKEIYSASNIVVVSCGAINSAALLQAKARANGKG